MNFFWMYYSLFIIHCHSLLLLFLIVCDYADCVIERVVEYGCFVSFLPPNFSGLLHISEWDHHRTESMANVCKVGDKVTVKLIKSMKGKYDLSRRALLSRDNNNSNDNSNSSRNNRVNSLANELILDAVEDDLL